MKSFYRKPNQALIEKGEENEKECSGDRSGNVDLFILASTRIGENDVETAMHLPVEWYRRTNQ
ncbi:hypothetical protein DSCW_19270 [Desulfosarcina widdelii]|uniref:Uncharacterized protein n=1 Tax=Desulfosarcina widdelii TaxID=947919 RepID=A0A5K7Z1H7_9BACT|nr:hypothetical protein DSCW_19270 [Desulfosarcina widdelii]